MLEPNTFTNVVSVHAAAPLVKWLWVYTMCAPVGLKVNSDL